MLRRFTIVLLVAVTTMVALYQLRAQLLMRAVNMALLDAQVKIVQLDGLNIAWRGVSADKLVIVLGATQTQQTLLGMHLAYSILDVEPHTLSIRKAVLATPESGSTVESAQLPVLLSELWSQLLATPLRSLTVDELELPAFSDKLPGSHISLGMKWDEGVLLLQAKDSDFNLVQLELRQPTSGALSLKARLRRNQQALLELVVSLSRKQNKFSLEGGGRLHVAPLLSAVSRYLELPDNVADASGELIFELGGLFSDDLTQLPGAKGQMQLLLGSKLAGEFIDENFSAKFLLVVQDVLAVSIEPGPDGEPKIMSNGGGLMLQIDEQTLPIATQAELTDINCSISSGIHCGAGLVASIRSDSIVLPGERQLTLEEVGGNIEARLEINNDLLSVVFKPGGWLSASSLAVADTLVEGLSLAVESDGVVNVQLSSSAVKLELGALSLQLPSVQFPGGNVATVLHLSDFDFEHSESGQQNFSAHIKSDDLVIETPEVWVPRFTVDTDIFMAERNLSLSGKLSSLGQELMVDFSAHYSVDTGQGSARVFNSNLEFGSGEKRLSQRFLKWPFEWDVLAGSTKFDLDLAWQGHETGPAVRAELEYSVTDLAGTYRDIAFIGLNGDVVGVFESPDRFYTTRPIKFSIDTLDVGVPIEAITGRVELDSVAAALEFESVRATLFGGRVWLEDAIYHADSPNNKIYVGVDGVQLNQLLDLAGYDAVQATGSISGLLPLDVSSAGMTMNRGMLAAKAPGGVFRYKAEVSTDINPAMVPVMAALKNYHYTIFQLEADYRDNGELKLAMKLRGSNPELQQGRPIHLNLNVTDNIPMLLKSLQSGRTIADTIERKVGGG